MSYYTGVTVHRDVVFQQPGIACFPLLQHLPLAAGFSWGKDASNMSFGTQFEKVNAVKANNTFLQSLSMPTLSSAVLIDPNEAHTSEIQEISFSMLASNTHPLVTGTNILFTRDPGVSLLVHPGDCPCAVLFAKDTKGQSILGLLHLGRFQTDMQLPKRASIYVESCFASLDTVSIGICPGISQKNYFIPVSSQEKDLPYAEKWGTYISLEKRNGKDVYALDLQGYIVHQFIQSGILPEHIEVYDVDTFASAEKGESFSHRYATSVHDPQKDGRFLIAARLS